MTIITFTKQLRKWLNGTLKPTRLVRNRAVVTAQSTAPTGNAQTPFHHTWTIGSSAIDRFASYKDKIMPKLQRDGYLYFRSASSSEYQMHEEWCHENCDSPTLPHCDVWQFDSLYPRAFTSETDATMFALTFDTAKIEKE